MVPVIPPASGGEILGGPSRSTSSPFLDVFPCDSHRGTGTESAPLEQQFTHGRPQWVGTDPVFRGAIAGLAVFDHRAVLRLAQATGSEK